VLAGHFERCGKEKTMHKVLLDRNPIDVGPDKASAYALGYSEREFKRLELQGAFIRDLTDDVLKRAGLTRGMRVLDLGCGVGDVSLMAGEVVGPTGAVLGVDRSAEAIATAERRAVEAGQCYWVRFAATELEHFVPDGAFDAIIGRLILMYLPDPAATLRRLAVHLRPGGIMAFQELAMPAAKIIPDRPIFSRCRRWILEAFERGGVEIEMGPRLFATFLEAGLPAPQMIAAQRVEGGPQTFAYDYVAETLRSLLPLMEQVGVATAEEVEVDTLAERLRGEALASSACIMLPPLVGAWTHIPA
jgi:ubiquinone/menaquinone biosynthesis C-methylase UbiE